MSGKGPTIAIIVVNYNGREHILNCLHAVRNQSSPATKVVVVDNKSDDGSAELVAENFPDMELIQESTNTGFAAANNHAIQTINGIEWVALLNPDTIADTHWLESLKQAIIENPDIQFFSSRLVNANNQTRLDGTGDVYHVSGLSWRRDHGAAVDQQKNLSQPVFSPCGAAALYRLDWFRQVNGFDERYFCYNEDIDLAFRLRLAGANCLHLDHSQVQHVGSGITGPESDFTIYHGHRNLVWTFFKNMPSSMLWWYLPQHILLNIITIIYFGFRGRLKIIVKSKWDAIRGLPGIFVQRKKIQKMRKVDNRQLKNAMVINPVAPYFKRHV